MAGRTFLFYVSGNRHWEILIFRVQMASSRADSKTLVFSLIFFLLLFPLDAASHRTQHFYNLTCQFTKGNAFVYPKILLLKTGTKLYPRKYVISLRFSRTHNYTVFLRIKTLLFQEIVYLKMGLLESLWVSCEKTFWRVLVPLTVSCLRATMSS